MDLYFQFAPAILSSAVQKLFILDPPRPVKTACTIPPRVISHAAMAT